MGSFIPGWSVIEINHSAHDIICQLESIKTWPSGGRIGNFEIEKPRSQDRLGGQNTHLHIHANIRAHIIKS